MSEEIQHRRTEKKEPSLEDLIGEDLEAEKYDHDKYIELAKQADCEYPERGYGSILRDIAKEEGQHRKHLTAILRDIEDHDE